MELLTVSNAFSRSIKIPQLNIAFSKILLKMDRTDIGLLIFIFFLPRAFLKNWGNFCLFKFIGKNASSLIRDERSGEICVLRILSNGTGILQDQ